VKIAVQAVTATLARDCVANFIEGPRAFQRRYFFAEFLG